MSLKTVCVIGLGHAGILFCRAFLAHPGWQLLATVETDPAKWNAVPPNVSTMGSLDEVIPLNPDLFVICTPTSTHAAFGQELLRRGFKVLIEKPVATSVSEFHRLGESAVSGEGRLLFALHAAFGPEVRWFRSFYSRVRSEIGGLLELEQVFQDPYFGSDRALQSLGDPWLDSAPNALSVSVALGDFVRVRDVYREPMTGDRLFGWQAECRLESPGGHCIRANMSFCWTHDSSQKRTRLVFRNGEIILDHSSQSVWDLRGQDQTLLYAAAGERLFNHYFAVVESISNDETFGENARLGTVVHQAVLSVF